MQKSAAKAKVMLGQEQSIAQKIARDQVAGTAACFIDANGQVFARPNWIGAISYRMKHYIASSASRVSIKGGFYEAGVNPIDEVSSSHAPNAGSRGRACAG